MGSNRFYISVLVNCLLIFAAAFLCFYFLQVREQPHTAAGIAILGLLLTFRLIYHVNRTNRILGNFLSYMQEKDPSLRYQISFVEKNFKGLNEALERMIREFKENRIDLQVQAHYLETILDNVSTGILTFSDAGDSQDHEQRSHGLSGDRTGQVHLNELDAKHPGFSSILIGDAHGRPAYQEPDPGEE
jgi:two-component system nitrogen regulation sensor histidine kinase NtrY